MAATVRYPAHAGTFYPREKEELIKLIEWSFEHPLGPGSLPDPTSRVPDRLHHGFVVPHAGYIYSGPVAAHAYYKLAHEKPPDAVVIAGPNHNGVGLPAAVFKGKAWLTSLGEVEVNMEVAKMIVSNTRYFGFDNDAHYYEHSVEVQVPFLQYIYGDDLSIVPIVIEYQSLDVARDLAKALAKIAIENGVDIVFLASSDFNHYEPHDVTVEKDMKAIQAILETDEEKLYRVLEEYNITMCGPCPVATLIVYSKLVDSGKPVLLKHATSGDITGEKDWVVGYASIAFPVKR